MVTPELDDPEHPTAVELGRAAIHDGRFTPAERRQVLAALLPAEDRASLTRFALMMTAAVAIAVMGLSADSAAVVIGAMLVAPLMTPIMTFAAATGLALGRRMVSSAAVVIVGSAASVGFSALLSRLLPDFALTNEVLARTSPDVRDLLVAIAAGAAGAYALCRRDVSASLPGVAVAVALVPPLATVGILLEHGRTDLARGAALLFSTNLVAIVASALVVFLATGVVPTIRLALRNPRVGATVLGVGVAVVAVGIPLTASSVEAARDAQLQEEVSSEVEAWLGDRDLDIVSLSVSGAEVLVELSGTEAPPSHYDLAGALVDEVGPEVTVEVELTQRSSGIARAGEQAPPQPEDLAAALSPAVEAWLSRVGGDHEISDISVEDPDVVLVVAGTEPPPLDPDLGDELARLLGRPVELTVEWTQRLAIAEATEPLLADQVGDLVDAWIGPRAGVERYAVELDGQGVLVTLLAESEPLGLDALQRMVDDTLGPGTDVRTRVLDLARTEPAPLPELSDPGL